MRSSNDTPALDNHLFNNTPLTESPRKQYNYTQTLEAPLKVSSLLSLSAGPLPATFQAPTPSGSEYLFGLDIAHMDTYELERTYLCATSNDAAIINWKRLAAKQLAHHYFLGKDAVRSPSLAHKYAESEIDLTPIEELENLFLNGPRQTASINPLRNQKFDVWRKQKIAERLAKELKHEAKRKWYEDIAEKLKQKHQDLKYSASQTALDNLFDKIYHLMKEAFGWFNAPRLAFSRFNTFLSGTGHSLLKTNALKIIARCFGLYFLIELIVEGAQIINHVFLHDKEKHESDSFWQRTKTRFYHVILHDDRWYRVINAIASLAINTIGLVISIINPTAAPFIFIILAVLMGTSDLSIEVGLLASGLSVLNSIFNRITPQKNTPTMKPIHDNIIEARVGLIINRTYVIFLMSLLVAGAIVASIFPPMSLLYLAGAISAFVFGSVLLGLGRKLFLFAVEKKVGLAVKIFDPIYNAAKQAVISLLTSKPDNLSEYAPIPSEPTEKNNSSVLVLEQITNDDNETKKLFQHECPDDHYFTTSLLKAKKENNILNQSASAQSLTEYAADSKKIKQLCQNSIHKSPSSGTLFKYDPAFAALIQPNNKQKAMHSVS